MTPSRRVISLAALTVIEVAPAEQVRIAADTGYSHVGLRLLPATPDDPHPPLLDDPDSLRALRAALADTGIGVLDIEIIRLTPTLAVGTLEPVIALGAALGARFALVAGNDPDAARMADSLAALCDLALPYGIVPHVEFMPWTDVPRLEDALRLADASHREAGVLIDAFHLVRSGGGVADVPTHCPRFGYVQLCDVAGPVPTDMATIIREARSERLFPGDGRIPLRALLAALPDGIPISVEAPSTNGASARDRADAALAATRRVLHAAIDGGSG